MAIVTARSAAAALSGSAAMLGEDVQVNELLLLYGLQRAARRADLRSAGAFR
ncbi:hypothetical protein ACFOPN_13240 [Xanthomonas hyacinthi]|uniref:hypothetical protein n=1 Tax=Xanthomonas hyacinthi TaxID=56455 RepID=UPI000ACF1C6C